MPRPAPYAPVDEKLDVRPFREAYEESGMSATDVAINAGWVSPGGKVDSSRVRRVLGITKRDGKYVEQISYDDAAAIVEALGLWPTDFGI